METNRSNNKGFVICLLLLASVANGYRTDFNDDLLITGDSKIYFHDVQSYLSFGTSSARFFHIYNQAATDDDIIEMLRIERETSGGPDDGMGAEISFYSETDLTNLQMGSLKYWIPTMNLQGASFAISAEIHGIGEQDIIKGGQNIGDISFYDTDSGYYTTFNFTGLSGDRILTFDMTDGARRLDMAENLYVEVGSESSRIDQDLTKDNSGVVFEDIDITTPSNIYALSHDSFADFEPNEHLDWTGETANFLTTGTLASESIDVNDGAVGTPTFAFAANTDTGLYRSGSGSSEAINFAINGARVGYFEGTNGAFLTKDSLSANYGKIIWAGTAMTSNRTFTLDLADGSRTLKMSANLTVEATSVINSDLSTDAAWETSSSITGGSLVTGGTVVATSTITGSAFMSPGFSGAGLVFTDNIPGDWVINDGTSAFNVTGASSINQGVKTTDAPGFATGVTIGNLTLADGSITDSSDAIDFGNEALTTSGNIQTPRLILNDLNTYVEQQSADTMTLTAGGVEFMRLDEAIFTDILTFNFGSVDLDVTFNGDTVADLLKIDAGTDTVNLKNTKITGLKVNIVAKTANYTVTASDDVIICGAGNETFTITLLAVASSANKVYHIKNVGTGTITVDGNGAETIDGGVTATLLNQFECISIICDGTEWWII